MKVANLL